MVFALGELGLLPEAFWDMTWLDYHYATWAHDMREAREWERTRELYYLVYMVSGQEPKSKKELMPLFTDEDDSPEEHELNAAFFQRMVENNFFQRPKPAEPTPTEGTTPLAKNTAHDS